MSHSKWNDTTQHFQFCQGLQGHIKDELDWMGLPDTLEGLIDLSICIGAQLFEWQQKYEAISQPPRPARAPEEPTSPLVDTMQINVMKQRHGGEDSLLFPGPLPVL